MDTTATVQGKHLLTCDDLGVNVESVIGWVNSPLAVILLAKHET